jgi:hypothetical protein
MRHREDEALLNVVESERKHPAATFQKSPKPPTARTLRTQLSGGNGGPAILVLARDRFLLDMSVPIRDLRGYVDGEFDVAGC